LAAPERLVQLGANRDARPLRSERRNPARVLALNGVLAAVEFRIADAAGAEVLSKKPCGGFLHVTGIAQRPKRIVEPEEKLQPFFVRTQLGFGLAVLERRPDSVGDVLHQRDLLRRPHARIAIVNPKRRDEPAVLDQQWTDIGADPRGL